MKKAGLLGGALLVSLAAGGLAMKECEGERTRVIPRIQSSDGEPIPKGEPVKVKLPQKLDLNGGGESVFEEEIIPEVLALGGNSLRALVLEEVREVLSNNLAGQAVVEMWRRACLLERVDIVGNEVGLQNHCIQEELKRMQTRLACADEIDKQEQALFDQRLSDCYDHGDSEACDELGSMEEVELEFRRLSDLGELGLDELDLDELDLDELGSDELGSDELNLNGQEERDEFDLKVGECVDKLFQWSEACEGYSGRSTSSWLDGQMGCIEARAVDSRIKGGEELEESVMLGYNEIIDIYSTKWEMLNGEIADTPEDLGAFIVNAKIFSMALFYEITHGEGPEEKSSAISSLQKIHAIILDKINSVNWEVAPNLKPLYNNLLRKQNRYLKGEIVK